MKTKQILMLILLGVSLAREAQAFYNPTTGRWLSRDPSGEKGGVNSYAFCRNKPIKEIDRLGLCCEMQQFQIISARWHDKWPDQDNPGFYDMSLQVDFLLILTPGSDKKDCRIRQYMRGLVTSSGQSDYHPQWTQDGPKWWWDGQRWAAGRGMSANSWQGNTVIFKDAPGFYGLKDTDFPVFFGGAKSPADFYDFDTEVVDYTFHPGMGGKTVSSLNWGMWIVSNDPSSFSRRYYIQSNNRASQAGTGN